MMAKFRKHSWLLALLLIPVLAIGVGGSMLLAQEDAITLAKMDAKQHTSKLMWFGAGFVFGVLGWIAAHVVEPSPPASRIVGKSPDWVVIYTETYKNEAKKIQTKYALYGCLAGGLAEAAALGCYYGLLASSLSSTTDYDYSY